jgi:DDE superfamily endonuclease
MFHHVLCAVITSKFRTKYLNLPNEDTPIPSCIRNNPKFWPFFKDALSTVDSTHIPCFPPQLMHAACRYKDSNITQNILAACTFLPAMEFCYVLASWEGSATDSFLWDEACFTGLHILTGKYYLGDAGFPASDKLLVPYRGTRYHLCEWGLADEQYEQPSLCLCLQHLQPF